MDTNINTIDSSYASDVVTYDDSQIDTVINELNEIDTDLWRKAIKTFGALPLKTELVTLSKFILKVA